MIETLEKYLQFLNKIIKNSKYYKTDSEYFKTILHFHHNGLNIEYRIIDNDDILVYYNSWHNNDLKLKHIGFIKFLHTFIPYDTYKHFLEGYLNIIFINEKHSEYFRKLKLKLILDKNGL